MKVRFSRTGGVAGVKLETELDSEGMPAAVAARLLELPKSARSREAAPSRARQADRFRYRIDLEGVEGRRTIELDEASLPEGCRPVVDYLVDAAKRGRSPRR